MSFWHDLPGRGVAFWFNRSFTVVTACALMLCWLLFVVPQASAQDKPAPVVDQGSYLINAGDVLDVDVWNESSLSNEEVLVRPDGFISIPVMGELRAGGRTIGQLQKAIATGLGRYLRDEPTVVVSVVSAQGSLVYVLGKVQRPGAFAMRAQLDVTQALALAGGINSFAAENQIKILRRGKDGVQRSVKFRYGQVKDGETKSNILLKSGDVVLVP